ncbi:glycosyltransferase family 2 protein [Marinimicrobium sp. C2-29]|uniref:glycosyltransferase family 2 protein n=1 Tax=Marinimicrobium sp. C2-29 TaxID=3139825 RepID=UPI003138E071
MTQEYPLVTIVITTFNCEQYVEETIQSAVDQDYPNLQIILVDDGSSDNTIALAERFLPKIEIVKQSNSGGPSKPRNTGLKMAKGVYISFLDGDDLLEPDRTRRQVEALEDHPDAAMCVGDYRNFKNGVVSEGHFSTCPQLSKEFQHSITKNTLIFPKGKAANLLLEENFSITVSVMYRTELVRNQNGFSEQLKACEDYHLNYRMAANHPVVVINEFVFRRRMHDSNVSSNTLSMLYHYTKSRILLMEQEDSPIRALKLRNRARSYFRSFVKLAIKKFQHERLLQALPLAADLYLKRMPSQKS